MRQSRGFDSVTRNCSTVDTAYEGEFSQSLRVGQKPRIAKARDLSYASVDFRPKGEGQFWQRLFALYS